MRFFSQLVTVVALTLLAVLGWDLSKRKASYGDRQPIIYAGMFGPGEPLQQLLSGPPPGIEAEHPFGPDALGHYAALLAAYPAVSDQVHDAYRRVFRRALILQEPTKQTEAAPDPAKPFDQWPLVQQFRRLKQPYIERLVTALAKKDRANRLGLLQQFAAAHPEHDRRLIQVYERLHPAYQVGLFEDFKRRHPQYEIIERWDGRWVLSSNRPRFLTGSDVPDIVEGSFNELRILMKEHLALPLARPLPDSDNPAWRSKGILRSESSYDDPNISLADTFYPWAIKGSTYIVTEEDVQKNNHPYPIGTKVIYLWPRIAHTQVVFYNRAHFRKIGRDGDDVPESIEELEDIFRQLLAAGIEPIAQDGMAYGDMWWSYLVYRTMKYDTYWDTCLGRVPRFAGADGDKRYVAVAERIRRWRDAGFWMKGFSASMWPGAQRDFGSGRCTFLFCGTWLPAEIASTRTWDPEVFDLSCFILPGTKEGVGNPRLLTMGAQGQVITRQGKNPEGAVLLLKFIDSRGAELLSTRLQYISTQKAAPLPPALIALEPTLVHARSEDVRMDNLAASAPKFFKFVFRETFSKFFVKRSDNLSPQEFVEELERRSQDHYRKFGKGT